MFQLCINGECTGSICLEWNLQECFLTSNIIPHIDKRKLCELACQNGTDPDTCRSTSEFAQQVGLPPGGISLRPGSPCDNFQVRTLFDFTQSMYVHLDGQWSLPFSLFTYMLDELKLQYGILLKKIQFF